MSLATTSRRLLTTTFGAITAMQGVSYAASLNPVEITIQDIQTGLDSGTFTSEDLVKGFLSRIDTYEPVYNAFITVNREEALAQAKKLDNILETSGNRIGPLHGVPVVIKDNIDIGGTVTSSGWDGYTIPGFEALTPDDATTVRKLKDAGAIILGETNVPDFAASDATDSTVAGRTGNAYNPDYNPGGSSGGTATAVAANMAVFGLGTDVGNSVRNPSANASLVGMIATRGLISIDGESPRVAINERIGPMTRTTSDLAIALDVLVGEDPNDPLFTEPAYIATNPQPAPGQSKVPAGSYTQFLDPNALKGKRLGVGQFEVSGSQLCFLIRLTGITGRHPRYLSSLIGSKANSVPSEPR